MTKFSHYFFLINNELIEESTKNHRISHQSQKKLKISIIINDVGIIELTPTKLWRYKMSTSETDSCARLAIQITKAPFKDLCHYPLIMREGNSLYIKFPIKNVMGSKTRPLQHIHVKLMQDCELTINNIKRETFYVKAITSQSEWIKNLFLGNPKPIKASILDMWNQTIYQAEITAVRNLEFHTLPTSMLPVFEEERAFNDGMACHQKPVH